MYRVLIVDDEPAVRRRLRGLVDWQTAGYQIVGEAADGEEALARCEALEPDLVITDIRMPALDGIELIRRLRAHHAGAAIVILTGYGEFEYAQEAMHLGVRHYLLKPLSRAELQQTLEEVRRMLRAPAAELAGAAPSPKGPAPTRSRRAVLEAARYVRRHYREPIDLKTLAGVVFLHPVYLGQVFHRETGKSLRDFLAEVRVQEAIHLLLESEIGTVQIGERVGYQTPSSFFRAFRAQTGMSPGRYRSTRGGEAPRKDTP